MADVIIQPAGRETIIPRRNQIILGVVGVVVLVVGFMWFLSARSRSQAWALLDEKNPSSEQIESIVDLLQRDEPELLMRLEGRILELGGDAVDALLKQCRGQDKLLLSRLAAARLAGTIDPEAGAEALEILLFDPDVEARRGAFLVLGVLETPHERIGEMLVRCADDSDDAVRTAAAAAIGRLSSKQEAIRALEQLSRDANPVTAAHAARELRDMRNRKPKRRQRSSR